MLQANVCRFNLMAFLMFLNRLPLICSLSCRTYVADCVFVCARRCSFAEVNWLWAMYAAAIAARAVATNARAATTLTPSLHQTNRGLSSCIANTTQGSRWVGL